MTYTPTDWKDHIVERPNRFRIVDYGDGTADILPEHGEVIQQGTPVNAANLNKMEQGIKDAHDAIATHLNETVTESVTITGTDITTLTTTNVALVQNRIPKGIRIYATAFWTSRGTSVGEYAQIGITNQCFLLYESGLSSVSTSFIALLGTNEANYMGARISAINEGYITLTWQKIGNPPPSASYMIQIVAIYHD